MSYNIRHVSIRISYIQRTLAGKIENKSIGVDFLRLILAAIQFGMPQKTMPTLIHWKRITGISLLHMRIHVAVCM